MDWGRLGTDDGGARLFFRAPGAERVIIAHTTGFYCRRCGTVVIRASTADDTEAPCLACGTGMAPGVTVCPECGWTYAPETESRSP